MNLARRLSKLERQRSSLADEFPSIAISVVFPSPDGPVSQGLYSIWTAGPNSRSFYRAPLENEEDFLKRVDAEISGTE